MIVVIHILWSDFFNALSMFFAPNNTTLICCCAVLVISKIGAFCNFTTTVWVRGTLRHRPPQIIALQYYKRTCNI